MRQKAIPDKPKFWRIIKRKAVAHATVYRSSQCRGQVLFRKALVSGSEKQRKEQKDSFKDRRS